MIDVIQRSRERIISDILETILRGRNIRTHIMYACNLSYQQLVYYIDFMIRKELIEQSNGDSETIERTVVKYSITKKGYEYNLKYAQLVRMIA